MEGILKATVIDHYNNGPQINHTSCIHKKRKKEGKEGASALKTLLVVIRGDFCSHENTLALSFHLKFYLLRVCHEPHKSRHS